MERNYAPLGAQRMRPGTVVRQPALDSPLPAALGDPALKVMTDLSRVPAVPVDPDVDIEAAMRIMIRRNVRSLFVLSVDNEVIGLVTATDLLGEKPLLHIQRYGGGHRDIRVRDLMTPHSQLEVLYRADVERACIGQIVATLRVAGRQHAMVVAEDAAGRAAVCGVFSATQIERQLGHPIAVGAPARTFAEIEAALAR